MPMARAQNPLGHALLGEDGFRNRVHAEIAAGRHDGQIAQHITIDAAIDRATVTARKTMIASLQSATHTPGGRALIERVRTASLSDTLAIASEIHSNPTALARTIVRGEPLVPGNAARIGGAAANADIRATLSRTIAAARSTPAAGTYSAYAPASCAIGDTHDGTRVHCTAHAQHPSSQHTTSKVRKPPPTAPAR